MPKVLKGNLLEMLRTAKPEVMDDAGKKLTDAQIKAIRKANPNARRDFVGPRRPTPTNPTPFDDIFDRAAREKGLDPDILKAIAKQESAFKPNAVSSAGAQGDMQLMPFNSKNLGITAPFDPEQNIPGGASILLQELDRYGTLDLALAAYNAGGTRVNEAITKAGLDRTTATFDQIQQFLPRETRNYVPKVMANYGKQTDGRLEVPEKVIQPDMVVDTRPSAQAPTQLVGPRNTDFFLQ